MLFCPTCGNSLLVDGSGGAGAHGLYFYCQTCPYIQKISAPIKKKLPLERKKVDDVLGGDAAWKNVDQTDVPCANTACNGKRAYFLMMQIRSADEPMTIFYRCTTCKKQWSSN